MRRNVELEICSQTIRIPVNIRAIEIVERVYDMNVDMVVSTVLTDPARIKLTDIASVLVEWISEQRLDLTTREVKEYLYALDGEGLNKIIGSIQAACLAVRGHINEEEFDSLVSGEDLPEEDEEPAKK